MKQAYKLIEDLELFKNGRCQHNSSLSNANINHTSALSTAKFHKKEIFWYLSLIEKAIGEQSWKDDFNNKLPLLILNLELCSEIEVVIFSETKYT